MKETRYTLVSNEALTENVYRAVLRGDNAAITAPGQFVNLSIEGLYLRRPISVCDVNDDLLTLIYKVVGHGTKALSEMKPGQTLDALTGLGNGYDMSLAGDRPVLLGGGVGVPPLYLLAKRLIAQGRQVTVCLGFNTASEVFYTGEFRALGADVRVATVDGSVGTKGFVTTIAPEDASHYFTCGPEPMLRAVWKTLPCSGQLSFEARMGCGFGACMGCTCKTLTGYKRICKDGPVMRKEEIAWDD